jgi:MFS family permease
VWRNRQTWAGLLAHFGLFGSFLALNGLWGVPYLMHVYGFDRVEASSYLLVASAGLLVSAPLVGHLSDRVLHRRRLPAVAMASLACAVWLALTFWDGGRPPAWALYPLFAAMGFSAGNVTLIFSGVKEANPPRLSGLAMGTANNGFLCAAVLQPFVGYVLDSHWQGVTEAGARVYPLAGYQVALGIMTAFVLLGLAGTVLMRETHCRNEAEG